MASERTPLTVVLVEDDAALRGLMVRLLQKQGFWTVALGSGPEALDLLTRSRADVVLTDWQMPGMSGVELARRVRSLWPDLPVIITSGCVLDAESTRAPEGVLYLAKPFGPSELGATIEQAASMSYAA